MIVATALVSSFASAQVIMRDKIVLDTRNTVTVRGEISNSSVMKAQLDLVVVSALRGKANYPLYLVLDTGGGSIEAGNDLIEFAKTIPNLKTVSIFSASMGSAIVQALPGERLITNNGYLMFHRAAGGFQGQFEIGEVESRLAMAKRLVQRMELQNYTRMRMSQEDYKRLVKDELWLDAEQSLKFRSADRIVDLYCSKDLIDSSASVTFESFFSSVTLKFSACPLFRAPLNDTKNKYQVPNGIVSRKKSQ
jgi:ATP-dependent protease ClpP protease subunit